MGTCLVDRVRPLLRTRSPAVGHRHPSSSSTSGPAIALPRPLLLGLPRRRTAPTSPAEPVHPRGLALAAVEEPSRRLVRGRQVQRRPEAQRRRSRRLRRRAARHRDADVLDRAGSAGLADRRDVRARLVRARARAAGAGHLWFAIATRGPSGDADRSGPRSWALREHPAWAAEEPSSDRRLSERAVVQQLLVEHVVTPCAV